MCVCHIEGEWCFYCEMYSPLEDEYRQAQTEIDRLRAFIQHESECAIDAVQELERLRLARDYWRKEAKDANLLCAELEGECVGHIAVLERIANATMSQYATIDDMIRGIKRIAREALEHGTQENNGR